MCGILGIYDAAPSDNFQDRCVNYLRRIHYRGPDDEGALFLNPNGDAWDHRRAGVFLGHKRLSIIDLSSSGHQPMPNEDKSVWVVFNGEIYNYLEIREELLKSGHRFISETDTEILLHGYEQWGFGVLDRLRGMFAFCIYDTQKRRFFLARDRMGQKPLVYTCKKDFFGFSSELKSLYSYPDLNRSVSAKAIHYFLTYQYIPGDMTIFEDIHKLLPAHYAVFNIEGNKFYQRRYWKPQFFFPGNFPTRRSRKKHLEELDALLTESVALRLRSDVPLGVFLSGGVDSSAITAYAALQLPEPPKTFSISFKEQAYDESIFARQVADHLKCNHHEYGVASEGLELLPDLVWFYNEPFGDSSAIPTYQVSRVTSEHVKVVLSGDGGDEVFLGYNRYLLYVTLKNILTVFKVFPVKTFQALALILSKPSFTGRVPGMLYNFFSRARSGEMLKYSTYISTLDNPLKETIYTPSFSHCVHPWNARDYVDETFRDFSEKNLKQAFSMTDFLSYLPGDILTKVDIASMANSLECRSPFLDHKLVEFAVRLHPSEKLAFLKGKRILKKVLANRIPAVILKRRKMGFGVPLREWFREKKWKETLNNVLLDRQALQRGYFRGEAIEGLIQEHTEGKRDRSAVLWQLLVLELWHRTYLSDDPGPVTF